MSGKYKNNMEKDFHLPQIYGSQNFLTSRRLLERIVKKSTITKNDLVIEIGTGKGPLTEVLCKKAAYVYSVEIDRKLYERAKERLTNKKAAWLRIKDTRYNFNKIKLYLV